MYTLDDITRFLMRWSDQGVLEHENGAVFICPLPDVAPKAWLHQTLPKLNEIEIRRVSEIVGFDLPAELCQLYRSSNGLLTFEALISITGLVENLSREIEIAQFQPFSIATDALTFHLVYPQLFGAGFFCIGGVSIVRNDLIVCNSAGKAGLVKMGNDEIFEEFSSIFELLIVVMERMALGYKDNGYPVHEIDELDQLDEIVFPRQNESAVDRDVST